MDKGKAFYQWYQSKTPYELMQMGDQAKDLKEKAFYFDLMNAKVRDEQKKIINGKFVM